MLRLVPRLNYKFTLKDAFTSFIGIFQKNISQKPLIDIFHNEDIYFVNHARTGIRIALNSLGLPKNARIGVQAMNCFTVFNAIKLAGFHPVFIDINDNFQIDLDDLNKKKEKIDALIITHLFGIPADFDKVKAITKTIPIIEDCAHSFLSRYKNKLTGTFGDISIFSVGKAKFPSIGPGGFIVINNKTILSSFTRQLNTLQNNTLFSEFKQIVFSLVLSILHNPFFYKIITKPFLKKIDNKNDFGGKFKFEEKHINKSIKYLFINKLNLYLELYKLQRKRAETIILKHPIEYVSKNFINSCYESNCFMIPLQSSDKNSIIKKYYNNGFEIGSHFNQSIKWAFQFGYTKADCKNTEKIIEKVVTIPTYFKF